MGGCAERAQAINTAGRVSTIFTSLYLETKTVLKTLILVCFDPASVPSVCNATTQARKSSPSMSVICSGIEAVWKGESSLSLVFIVPSVGLHAAVPHSFCQSPAKICMSWIGPVSAGVFTAGWGAWGGGGITRLNHICRLLSCRWETAQLVNTVCICDCRCVVHLWNCLPSTLSGLYAVKRHYSVDGVCK